MMGSLGKKSGRRSKIEYMNLLPWRRRYDGGDEELADDRTVSEVGSQWVGPSTPSYYSICEGDLFFLLNNCDPAAPATTVADGRCRADQVDQELMMAMEKRDLDAVQRCLDSGADVDTRHGINQLSALHLASGLCFCSGVDLLLRSGAKVGTVDSRGVTPLHVAARAGDAAIVRKLISAGAQVSVHDQVKENGSGNETPLHWAAFGGHLAALLELLSAGAEVNAVEVRGRTALHYAAQRGEAHCIRALLDYEADPNAMDHRGATALLLLGGTFVLKRRGRFSGFTQSVQCLVKGGARVNVRDADTNVTPLHQAAILGRLEAMQCLLNEGAEVNAQDHEGYTALHLSSQRGQASAVKLLVSQSPANRPLIDLEDCQGRTALHKAAYRGSGECVQILLKEGADLGKKTKAGVSAMALILQLPTGTKILQQRFNSAITTNDVDPAEFACRLKFDYSVLISRYKCQQMGVIEDILDAGRRYKSDELLQHPLVESFLFLKWRKIRMLFFSNIFFYTVLVVGVTAYIMSAVPVGGTAASKAVESNGTASAFGLNSTSETTYNLQLSLMVIILSIIAQELLQLATLHVQYFRETESWIKFGALLSSTAVIFADTDKQWVKHCSAFAIFLGWTEVMLLIGRLPIFGVYPLMFYSVGRLMVKLVCVFVFFLAGFAFSFHMVFPDKESFTNPWISLLRTVAMLVGDMDFDSYFGKEHKNLLDGTAHILYFLFLILVALVLMNLLIGLAVSDIQGLQKEGRIKRLRKQAQFIVYLEDVAYCRALSFLLRSKTEKLKGWVDQESVVVLHPAARRQVVPLPAVTVERALAIAQEGQVPVDHVSVSDVYGLMQECSQMMQRMEGRLSALELLIRGPDSPHGARFDQADTSVRINHSDEASLHGSTDDDEDQTDGGRDAESNKFDRVSKISTRRVHSLRDDIEDIRRILADGPWLNKNYTSKSTLGE